MKVLKKCNRCGEKKTLDRFYLQKQKNGTKLPMSRCKDCHSELSKARLDTMTDEQRDAYYEAMRSRKLLATFGLTPEQYQEIWEAQGGVCALCGKPETAKESRRGSTRTKMLAVDHDHLTGEVRGLLCMLCNTRMGYFEKHELVSALLDYLKIGALI